MIRARLPRYKTDPRITCIPARIANDICIRVRITGIRVRIAMRGRIAEVVLGCSGHYIDPRFYHLDRMRQQDTLSGLEKLHSVPYTFSIRN